MGAKFGKVAGKENQYNDNIGGSQSSTAKSEEDEEKYEVRPGTIDRGKEYEYLIIGHLTLSLVLDNAVQDFKISSNDNKFTISKDKFCAFDDIVVEISEENKTERYAIQVKHINTPKTLKKDSLKAKKGDFAIARYLTDYLNFKDVLEDHDLIMFTNYKFDDNNNEHIRISDESFDIKISRNNHKSFLEEYPNETLCFSFEIVDNEDSQNPEIAKNIDNYKPFLKKFFLYANQVDADNIEHMILKKFQTEFQCSKEVSYQYIDFIKKWYSRNRKEKLSKTFLKQAIALLLLSPHIQPFIRNNYDNDYDSRFFRRMFFRFNVVFFNKKHVDKIKRVRVYDAYNISDQDKTKLKTQYHIGSNDEEMNKILWLVGEVPLIVFESESTYKAINLCSDKKFIILGTTFCREKLITHNICQKLGDLDPDIVKAFKCSLGGIEFKVTDVLEHVTAEFENIITTEEIIQIWKNSLTIGKEEYQDPFYVYINRLISTNIVTWDYLKEIEKDVLIVISCLSKFKEIQDKLGSLKFIRVKDGQNLEEIERNDSTNIYVFDEVCNFDQLCRSNVFKNQYHHLKVFGRDLLEWVKSKGDIEELRKHVLEGPTIDESVLPFYETFNNINVICSVAGMGKSELMKSLKTRPSLIKDSIEWTILISVKDHSTYFKNYPNSEDESNFLNHILKEESKDYNDFELNCLNVFVEKKKLRLLWDGLDEVPEEIFNKIKNTIRQLSQKNYKQWITARSNLTKTLENEFQVFSKTIKEFNDEDRYTYIKKKLLCSEKCDERVMQIIEMNRAICFKDVLKIPSELSLFTEWLRKEHSVNNTRFHNNACNYVFSIADVYGYIVNEKINNVFLKKLEIGENNIETEFVRKTKERQLQFYQTAALGTFLGRAILEYSQINSENERLEDDQKQYSIFGIVLEISNNMTKFLHDSYGEYFSARYFKENKDEIGEYLEKFIFKEKYNNIRFFFDLILAENSPLHVAVLNRIFENLEQFGDLNSVDQGGRTPLHLLCSWGQRFHRLQATESADGSCEIADKNENSVYFEYEEIKKCSLFKKCDSAQDDHLFKLSPLLYADRAFCLLPILCLLENDSSLNFNELKNFDLKTVSHYSDKFGCKNASQKLNKHVTLPSV